MKIAFVGAGKMATAIATGIINAGQPFAKENMLACDAFPPAAEAFTEKTGVPCSQNLIETVEGADLILLAVKPQNIPDLLPAISKKVAGKTVVSIAAGVKLKTLLDYLATDRVVRVMPNTPMLIGEGASALAFSDAATDSDRKTAMEIFEASGIAYELDESLIDAVTAVSGSGPAYFFEMIDAIAAAGAALGLPADVAMELTIQTARGAAGMLKAKTGTARELRDAVTSPGGTTAAALETMRERDFRGLVSAALAAAKNRAVELGES